MPVTFARFHLYGSDSLYLKTAISRAWYRGSFIDRKPLDVLDHAPDCP
jgi:hypothetical protein